MFEEFLVVPQQSIQVRHPKLADPAPKGDEVRRRDNVDRVPLDETEVADDGKNCFTGWTCGQLACKMLLRYSQTPCGFQGRRDRRFTQRFGHLVSRLLNFSVASWPRGAGHFFRSCRPDAGLCVPRS